MAQTYFGPPFHSFERNAYFPEPRDGGWGAAKFFPDTGQVVLQLGAEPPQTEPVVRSLAVMNGPVPNKGPGFHHFNAVIAVGPVTMLPRGANLLDTRVQMLLSPTPRGAFAEKVFPAPPRGVVGANYGIVNLGFTANLRAGVKYDLVLLTMVEMDYDGTPSPLPYGEIIATFRSAIMVDPFAESVELEGVEEEQPAMPDLRKMRKVSRTLIDGEEGEE